MRKRGVGISGLERQTKTQEHYKELGDVIQTNLMVQMREQLSIFKMNLEEFARNHHKDIKEHPEFRAYFQKMCSRVGIDPFSSSKGFWEETLHMGDFYYELSVQIVDICLRTRSTLGGLIDIQELLRRLTKIRGIYATPISEDDILRSVKKLQILGKGLEVIVIGPRKILQSIPQEMNMDQTTVLMEAESCGYFFLKNLRNSLKWSEERLTTVLEDLVEHEMVWIDDQMESGERAYWVPCFSFERRSDE